MNGKKNLNRILCAILVVLLLAGVWVSVSTGSRETPEDPVKAAAEAMKADPMDGGSHAQRQEERERQQAERESEQQQEQSPEDEAEDPKTPEEREREKPETQPPPEDTEQPEPAGEQETPSASDEPTDPSQSDEPGKPGDDGDHGGNGDAVGPDSGDSHGDDPSGEPGGDGAETPDTPAGPSDDEVRIATDLTSGIVTQTELTEDMLRFYAYGVGANDLTVRIYVRPANSRTGKWLESPDGRNWSLEMVLGETYTFYLYLYQPGKPTPHPATRTVTYQARRADEDEPEVCDYPPFITTNIDDYADDVEIKVENLTLIVTVLSNPDRKVITADKIVVKLNGKVVQKHGGDSSPEYDLFFEPPNVGDYKDYKIEIIAWYGNNSRYWSRTLRYHAIAEGDTAGTVSIVLDATTVGLGVLDSSEYEIKKGDTAADVLLRFLEDFGYEIRYDSSGANFYIRRIYRPDMCWGAKVPTELWNAILRDGINLNENSHSRDSLGEFDYTMGAGWMYAVDGAYPGRAMNRYEVKNGDTIAVRFSLAYGKDIGGFGAAGGYGRYSSYCGLWIGGSYTPLGHRYEETARQDPTYTEEGYVEHTCMTCGDTYREILPVLEHEHAYEETGRVEPTETEDGYVEYTCTMCGDTYREVLPATGTPHEHEYVETARVEPTETEDGYVEYTCTECGHTYRDVLPATGQHEHEYVETDRMEPTETEDGYVEYTCTECGHTYRDVLPATGQHEHEYVETDRMEPTETEDGYVEYTCTECGHTYRDVLPATGGSQPDPGGEEPPEEPPPEDDDGNE